MDLARDHGVEIISYTIFPLPEWQPIYAASRKDGDSHESGGAIGHSGHRRGATEHVEQIAAAIRERGMKPRPIANFFHGVNWLSASSPRPVKESASTALTLSMPPVVWDLPLVAMSSQSKGSA